MPDIDYTDPRYKEAAIQIAEAEPRHLDQPTSPPIHWRLEIGPEGVPPLLRVLLADGRTVRRNLPSRKPNVAKIMTPPTHPVAIPPQEKTGNLPASHPPAKSKAGK